MARTSAKSATGSSVRYCARSLRFSARKRRSAFEDDAQPRDLLRGPAGQVEKSSLLDLAALAIGFAQKRGRRRITIGDGLNVHDRMWTLFDHTCQDKSINHKIYLATLLTEFFLNR
jgi:hypothetical protein